MTYSLYYGRPASANAFPGYSDAELRRDLQSPSIDDATRTGIEAELTRRRQVRATKRRAQSDFVYDESRMFPFGGGTD
jgi:hypothetical protein